MLKITPNATPSAAANNTCSVPCNRNVIVCAGYQFFMMDKKSRRLFRLDVEKICVSSAQSAGGI